MGYKYIVHHTAQKKKFFSYSARIFIPLLAISTIYGSSVGIAYADPTHTISKTSSQSTKSPSTHQGHSIFSAIAKILGFKFPSHNTKTNPAPKTTTTPPDQSGTTYSSPSPTEFINGLGKTPVILVHGTLGNTDDLKNIRQSLSTAGIPTYGITFGTGGSSITGILSGLGLVPIGGVNSVSTTEKQLADFIQKVQKETGAKQVDLIGHSQGGLLIKDYIAKDTENNVKAVVDLGADNHGSTLDGASHVFNFFPPPVKKFLIGILGTILGQGVTDQLPYSKFINTLNKFPDTKAGIHYLVIGSRDDLISTPYQNTYLKAVPGADVTNIEAHSIPGVRGFVDHITMPSNPTIIKYLTKYIEEYGETPPTVKTPPTTEVAASTSIHPHESVSIL